MLLCAQVDTVVFDKTGTLTHGTPVVTTIIMLVSESICDERRLLELAGAAEANSEHPLGRFVSVRKVDLGEKIDLEGICVNTFVILIIIIIIIIILSVWNAPVVSIIILSLSLWNIPVLSIIILSLCGMPLYYYSAIHCHAMEKLGEVRLPAVMDYATLSGRGVKCTMNAKEIVVGSPRLIGEVRIYVYICT